MNIGLILRRIQCGVGEIVWPGIWPLRTIMGVLTKSMGPVMR